MSKPKSAKPEPQWQAMKKSLGILITPKGGPHKSKVKYDRKAEKAAIRRDTDG